MNFLSQLPDRSNPTALYWLTTNQDNNLTVNGFSQAGWSAAIPQISRRYISWKTTDLVTGTHSVGCKAAVDFVYQDAQGVRHNLGLTNYSDPGGTGACTINSQNWPNGFSGSIVTQGGEGSIIASLPSTNWPDAETANVTVVEADGTALGFFAGLSNSIGVGAPVDRYGNKTTVSTTNYPAFTLTDSAGRTTIQDSGFAVSPETITVSGLTNHYSVNWTTLSTPTFTTPITALNGTTCTAPTHFSWGAANDHAVSSFTLPNGKSFTLSYDPTYGLVNKVTYPSGGYVRYVWGMNSQAQEGEYVLTNGQSNFPCQMYYGTPAVTDRYVSFDGVNEVLHQVYTYSTVWQSAPNFYWSSKTTNVKTYDLLRNNSFETIYTYAPTYENYQPNAESGAQPQIAVESSVAYYNDLGSTLLKTVSKAWANERLLTSSQTTYPNGPANKTTWSYDSNEMQIEQDDYDLGASGVGSLLRKSITAYATFGTNHIVDKPSSVTVYDSSGTNKVAETDSTYDSPAGTVTSGVVNHAAGCNCASLTKESRWLNSSGSTLNTTFTNDDTGQRLSMTDPRGNTTSYSYVDSYSSGTPPGTTNTYLTQVTYPTTGVAHVEKFSYAYASGEVTSTTDQNNLVTSYLYTDSLARLTETDFPDGGKSTISYNDTAPSPSITTSKQINPSQSVTTVSVRDGMGHATQTQLTSDPQGTVYTDTTFDGQGLVWKQSNPYRTGTDITTTSGTTIFAYDGIGRKVTETYPDNSVLTTAYCAGSTLVTDPTTRWRRSRTDGLGRLVEVDEPNSSTATVTSNGCPGTGEPIWVTSYTLDTLGNLKTVLQNGSRQRNFTYDWTSRLLTANNPETGTITYNYDADANCSSPNSFAGLLVSKVDGRGLRTCSQFDALNRETVRNYSNGDSTVSTSYDQPNCLGLSACQNIGRRTSMTDAAGSEIWAYQVDATNHRSVHKDQRTTSGVTKTTTYVLDNAGNTTQATYPTGRVVNYTFDNANRPSTAADSANGLTYATGLKTSSGGTCLANVTCYTPQGTFYALSIGQSASFTNGLNLTHIYNSRLQPQEFKASSTGGNAIDITYSFQDQLNNNKNAGHVFSITNNLDSTRSQTFTYDQLNRINAAQTTSTHATSPTHCWGETYQFDGVANGAWGNLTQIAATTNPAYTGCSQESGFSKTADGNNHLSGFSYDASGNTSGDGVNAYAWDGESRLKSAAGVNYLYDGDDRRVYKSSGKLYWYDGGSEILAETDASGNTTAEYIFFGGKRIASIAATTTAIQNASFETYNTLNSSNSTGRWNTGPIPGWTLGGGTGGSIQPSTVVYTSLPAGPTVAYSDGGTISQTLTGIGLQPNTTYTLSVYIGHRLDGFVNNYTISLHAGSTVLQSVSGSNSTITAGTFANVVLTYTSGSTVASGDLTIVLTGAGTQIDFDEVQLTGAVAPTFYVEDLLGTSRIITTNAGVVCYDADFYPYGGERPYTNTCPQNYKFEGKERDTETGNDDFGARYYSNRFGRWLSADWSAKPEPVPYANLSNPQTLNLYSMVADDPESFADLDGHCDVGGEHHWGWCIWHTLGFYQTRDDRVNEARGFFNNNSVRINGHIVDPSKLTNQQVLDAFKIFNDAWRDAGGAQSPGAALGAMLPGANGTQVTSKTLWEDGKVRIDVENPNPGKRAGQIHYQDETGKYIYNLETKEFEGLSKTQSQQLLNKPAVQEAIKKGLKYLGEPGGE